MQSRFQIFNHTIWSLLSSSHGQLLIRFLLMMSLLLLCTQVFADDDPFKGTESGLVASLSAGGTARKFIYLVEGIVGAGILIASRNILKAFTGVAAIEILLRLIFKMAGI